MFQLLAERRRKEALPPSRLEISVVLPYVSGGLAEVTGVESLRCAGASQGIPPHVI